MIPDPVDVPLIKIVKADEWADLQVECLTDKGFVVKAMPDGAVSFEPVPEDQGTAQWQAYYECHMSYWTDPYESTWILPVQPAEDLYDHLVTESLPCIESKGLPVDDEVPSREVWVAARTQGQPAWSPYDAAGRQVTSLGIDAWYDLVTDCPDVPPDFYPSAGGE